MLTKIGLNVDYISTDWGTVVQRTQRKQSIAEGGWSIFGLMWGGYDWYSPAGDAMLRGNGPNGSAGWPTLSKMESLRDQWLRAPDMPTQNVLARDNQLQAFTDVPCLPQDLYYQPVAHRNDLTDMMKGLILFTGIRRLSSQVVSKLLEARGLKAWLKGDYVTRCEPALRAVFSPGATGSFFVQASKVSLDVGDKADWIRCERCTSVSARNPLIGDNCCYCGGVAKLIDPASDVVFRSRKAFYRRLWERLSNKDDGYAPHQLIAEEHSAALNDSGMSNAMSRNEAYELRFQDISIEQDGQVGSPIDILSCTTTMEVGIDIGGLTAVALRNVPPGRANYQQRAGRAGRRGAGLSTVVMFCGADSHDQSFFRDPAPIVAGPAPDPILNLDNPVIARRQAFAYLIGRFQQDRINTVGGSSDVFSSLGSVADFVGGAGDVFSLAGLRQWITDEHVELRADLRRLFTASCPALDADELLDQVPRVLNQHLAAPQKDVKAAAPPPVAIASDDVEDETIEDSGDDDHGVVDSGKLLDRLFDEGLLPKYAFPTDVATFSVFEEGTDPWNPKRRYSPQQSLNAALSQYAPGHEVWVDGQRYLSLGLYADREDERFDAYRDKRLYYQCRVCNYADLKQWDEGYPEQTRDCPACSGRATLGPARRWVRPPGFSHPPSITALPPDFDAGTRLRPTRATLDSLQFADAARIGGEMWPIGTGWSGWSDSKTLVVTNRGSLSATDYGFNYCTLCGRIEPAEFDPAMRQLGSGQAHNRPRPNRPKETDQCTGRVAKIVLGNEFRTDVAVFRLALPNAWQLDPTGLRRQSRRDLQLKRCGVRLARSKISSLMTSTVTSASPLAMRRISSSISIFTTKPRVAPVSSRWRHAIRIVWSIQRSTYSMAAIAMTAATNACARTRTDTNTRFSTDGSALTYCALRSRVSRSQSRWTARTMRSPGSNDLKDSGARVIRADGGLIDEAGQVICLAHPFLENEPCSLRARKLAAGKASIPVDILLVLRALPIASNVAVSAPKVDLAVSLKSDANGVPELTAAQAVVGDTKPSSTAPRFLVPDTENGDFLFRLDANTLSGKKGDGSGEVPKGTMCLFRPFSGDPPGPTLI